VASTAGAFDNILMNGQEVFKFAVRAVPTVRAGCHRLHSMEVYIKGHPCCAGARRTRRNAGFGASSTRPALACTTCSCLTPPGPHG
jgi:hypothetical protein